jgi:hypothetical protein
MSTMATTMTVKERELLTKIKAAVALLHGQPSTTPKPAFPSCQKPPNRPHKSARDPILDETAPTASEALRVH